MLRLGNHLLFSITKRISYQNYDMKVYNHDGPVTQKSSTCAVLDRNYLTRQMINRQNISLIFGNFNHNLHESLHIHTNVGWNYSSILNLQSSSLEMDNEFNLILYKVCYYSSTIQWIHVSKRDPRLLSWYCSCDCTNEVKLNCNIRNLRHNKAQTAWLFFGII